MPSAEIEPGLRIVELSRAARESALPTLREGFVGVYRWHAKRMLSRVPSVRAALQDGLIVGVALLDRLEPEVGYVYYLAVGERQRRRGVGGALLDDALERFSRDGCEVVYAAVERENAPSVALFRSRGLRLVQRDERSYRDGGLGARGLRTRMRIVSGELLFGRRLLPPPSGGSTDRRVPLGAIRARGPGGSRRP